MAGRSRQVMGAMLLCAAVLGAASPISAQPAPTPDPFRPHVFYGAVPPGGAQAPVLVFVHGVNGVASDWWLPPNDMYMRAYQAGYRTAFVSLSQDNTRNNLGVIPNALAFRSAILPIIVRFAAPNVYIVAHSKGGVDVQAAMLDPAVSYYVKAVFTIATPHHGTELADWAFGAGQGMAGPLGLLTAAVNALQTGSMFGFRQLVDPVARRAGVRFYTISASNFANPPHPLTSQTGPVLSALTGQPNDGVVTVPRTRLPAEYSSDLGAVPVNHFAAAAGAVVFPRIHAQIQAIESGRSFERIAVDGFGDRQNSFPWSAQWFKGKLYVGTGRAFMCVTVATNDAATGANDYPPQIPNIECTPDPKDLPLAAEIWRFTPETGQWERVYVSPVDVPIEFDANGQPTKFTARDIAFRGMTVFKENDAKGTERLYVGGVSASSLFDTLPAYTDPDVRRFPPPRVLWTENGRNWNVVPQTPGTFLGDLNVQDELVRRRGFRSFTTLRDANGVNRLFATVSDLRGVGRIVMSSNPSAGDNAWQQVSPSADDMPVFTIYPYRNQLYATVGDLGFPGGYAVFRTDAATPDPSAPGRYLFTPVVAGDGLQLFRPYVAVSMKEFQGSLYVGTDRPTEIIRINPDDSWDLIVGTPRMTLSGYKRPLSGLRRGLNNPFSGHFHSMAVHDGELYVGTWDWSEQLRNTPFEGLFNYEYGFDLFKTRDGIYWNVITRNGFGDGGNASLRNLNSTPLGLFVSSTNAYFGLQIFRNSAILDLNRDGAIDSKDVDLVMAARNTRADGPADPRDLNSDGMINVHDARILATQCTNADCQGSVKGRILPPGKAKAVSTVVTSTQAIIGWEPSPDAARYHVYRADLITMDQILPPDMPITLSNGATVSVQAVREGARDPSCENGTADLFLCTLLQAIRENATLLQAFTWIATTELVTFTDPAPASSGGALYYVAAENTLGQISEPSNVIVAPSEADAPALGRLGDELLRVRPAIDPEAFRAAGRELSATAGALADGQLAATATGLRAIDNLLHEELRAGRLTADAGVFGVTDNLRWYIALAESGALPAEAVASALLRGQKEAVQAALSSAGR